MKHGQDKQTVMWIKNWLICWTQRVEISNTKPSWRPVTTVVPQRLASSLVTWVTGHSAFAASLETIWNCQEWLMCWSVVLPFKGTSRVLRNRESKNFSKFIKGRSKVVTSTDWVKTSCKAALQKSTWWAVSWPCTSNVHLWQRRPVT